MQHSPTEALGMLNDIKMSQGEETLEHSQHAICIELMSTKHNDMPLVSATIRTFERIIIKPRKGIISE